MSKKRLEKLHAEILALQEVTEKLWAAHQTARGRECEAWKKIEAMLRDQGVVSCPGAQKLIIKMLAGEYESACKKTHRLFKKWMTLTNRCDSLKELELTELKRGIDEAGKK